MFQYNYNRFHFENQEKLIKRRLKKWKLEYKDILKKIELKEK